MKIRHGCPWVTVQLERNVGFCPWGYMITEVITHGIKVFMKLFVQVSGNVIFLVLILCSLSLVAGKRQYSVLPGFEITLKYFSHSKPLDFR